MTDTSLVMTKVNFRCPLNDLELFKRRYPYCMSNFLRLCLAKALSDVEFFNSIYFGSTKVCEVKL